MPWRSRRAVVAVTDKRGREERHGTRLVALGLQESAPKADPPRAPSWDDFPVFVWREKYAGKPLPDELVSPFGGVILMRDEDSSWARERGLAYLVWNVAGRNALHLDADEAWRARVEQWIQPRTRSSSSASRA
jgi:hypothetical protein